MCVCERVCVCVCVQSRRVCVFFFLCVFIVGVCVYVRVCVCVCVINHDYLGHQRRRVFISEVVIHELVCSRLLGSGFTSPDGGDPGGV